MASGPARTCIGCRECGTDEELIRLVRSPQGDVVVDLRRKLPGRGAWVHPRQECLRAAAKALSRAFKAPTRVDADELLERVRSSLQHAAADGLSLAAAAGAVAGGRAAVQQALKDGKATHVLVASDASDRARRDAETFAGNRGIVPVVWTTDELGQRTGSPPRAMLAVLDHPASQHLRRQLRRLRQLG